LEAIEDNLGEWMVSASPITFSCNGICRATIYQLCIGFTST